MDIKTHLKLKMNFNTDDETTTQTRHRCELVSSSGAAARRAGTAQTRHLCELERDSTWSGTWRYLPVWVVTINNLKSLNNLKGVYNLFIFFPNSSDYRVLVEVKQTGGPECVRRESRRGTVGADTRVP